MFHKWLSQKSDFFHYNIIVPILFSHAAHADQVKRDFLESASNSANFSSRQSEIHCTT